MTACRKSYLLTDLLPLSPHDSSLEGSLTVTHCLRSVGRPDACVCAHKPVCTCVYSKLYSSTLPTAAFGFGSLSTNHFAEESSLWWSREGSLCGVRHRHREQLNRVLSAFQIAAWCGGTAGENTSFYLLS